MTTEKCPNCGNIVTSDYIDRQPGLTPVRFFWCSCGCNFRRVVHDVSFHSAISSVPDDVREEMREKREDIILRKRNLYWRLVHGKWM